MKKTSNDFSLDARILGASLLPLGLIIGFISALIL